MTDFRKMSSTLFMLGCYASYSADFLVLRPKSAKKILIVRENSDKRFVLCLQESDEYIPLAVLNGSAGLIRVRFPCVVVFDTFEEALNVGLTLVNTDDAEYAKIKKAVVT